MRIPGTGYRHQQAKESGQSTIEFALTLSVLFSFALFFIQLCLVFGFGNYIHYATYMSARAYLSGGANIGDQKERAKNVIIQTVKKSVGQQNADRFPSIAKAFEGQDLNGTYIGPGSEFQEGDRGSVWMQGVRYKFRSRIIVLPIGRSAGRKDQQKVTLTSESWLGREPTYDECRADMAAGGKHAEEWIFDNGC